MMSVLPFALNTSSPPPLPRRRYAWFGTGTPGRGLRVDARGRAVPVGQTVTYDGTVLFTDVTLTTTAFASAGTGDPLAIASVRASAVPSGAWPVPVPSRLSTNRFGASGTKAPPVEEK